MQVGGTGPNPGRSTSAAAGDDSSRLVYECRLELRATEIDREG